MEEKILYLSLKKEWFDLIKAGVKREEYREMKPYWEKRLVKKTESIRLYNSPWEQPCTDMVKYTFKKFTHVVFRNGYGDKKPMMKFKITKMSIGEGNPELGAPKGEDVFIIKFE